MCVWVGADLGEWGKAEWVGVGRDGEGWSGARRLGPDGEAGRGAAGWLVGDWWGAGLDAGGEVDHSGVEWKEVKWMGLVWDGLGRSGLDSTWLEQRPLEQGQLGTL